MRRVLATAALLAATAPALAAPVIDRVDTEVVGNRGLRVTVEATFSEGGQLVLAGDVNGREVSVRKRVRRAGTVRFRKKVDARRLRLRKLDAPLVFDLEVRAEEAGGGATTRDVDAAVPVPVVFVAGLGNELGPDGSGAFVTALDVALGGVHETGGKRPTLVVHRYASLESSLPALGRDLGKTVKGTLRGTPFACVDVVGYSMGGLVARRFAADDPRGRLRRVLFLATPNEGAPLAQLLAIGLQTDALGGLGGGLIPDLGGLADLTDLLGLFVDPDQAVDVLRVFYPSYPWLFVTVDAPLLGTRRIALTPELIRTFGPLIPGLADLPLDLDSPLTPLNAVGPSERTAYFAIGYSAVPTEALGVEVGTLDEVDLTPLLEGGTVDPLALASGDGDGLVPWRSLVMADTPAWAPRIVATDLGTGTHVTLLADPRCIARVAEILAE